jgi:type IV pilus modification protein PilV
MSDNYKRDHRNDAGLSLLEVLIAMTIFSIGILAVASLQFSSSLLSRNSADITQASNLASDHMERLMLLPYAHADLTPGSISRTSGKYNIIWDVAEDDLNADTVNDAKTINLSVVWSGNQRRVKVSFIKHDDL